MTYDHKSRSFTEALNETDENLDRLFKIASKLFHDIQHERKRNRSESVEIIEKAIKGKTKKEIAIISFFVTDRYNREMFDLIGNIVGSIITEAMIKASDFQLPVPIMATPGQAIGFEEIMKMMMGKPQEKKKSKDSDKKQKNYQNYIG